MNLIFFLYALLDREGGREKVTTFKKDLRVENLSRNECFANKLVENMKGTFVMSFRLMMHSTFLLLFCSQILATSLRGRVSAIASSIIPVRLAQPMAPTTQHRDRQLRDCAGRDTFLWYCDYRITTTRLLVGHLQHGERYAARDLRHLTRCKANLINIISHFLSTNANFQERS